MESIDNTTDIIKDFKDDEMKKDIATVFKFVLYNLIIYILKLPYALFKKSINSLALLSKKGSLRIAETDSKWPFLSWLKIYLLDFSLDAATFLAYIVGYPLIILSFILSVIDGYGSFGDKLGVSFLAALSLYFAPMIIAIIRDLMQILILPFRKYIDWAKKPAQHMEIDHSGGIKNNH